MLVADALRVVRIFCLVAPTLEITEHRPAPGRAQALDRGVRMLGRMMDLAHVHDPGHAGVDLCDAAEKLVDEDVLRPIDHRELLQDQFIVVVRALWPSVVDEDAVGEDAAQAGLELMVMTVDEARHDDMSRRINDGRVGRRDGRRDLGDRRALDKNIARRVIADPFVHGEDRPAFDQRPPALGADTLRHRAARRAALRLTVRSCPPRRGLCCEDRARLASCRGEVADGAH